MAVGWGGSQALNILVLTLAAHGSPPLLLVPPAFVATGVMAFTQWRLVANNSIMSRHFSESGYDPADLEEGRRLVDREELSALRRLYRRAITRVEYERIIAYRHYVHGEITHGEYEAVLRYLAVQEPPSSKAPL
jgi:hypothetical protein